MRIRVATRGSALARWQADRVVDLLLAAHPGLDSDLEVVFVVVETTGDRDRTTSLEQMGGQGVFVKEVQAAVLAGRADVAVHSAKDLPAITIEDLILVSVPERADPRDALVGCRWDDLRAGATVATGSIRRRAHLAHLRPDLSFAGLRGNIGTRIQKAADFDAAVIAAAAIDRLGIQPNVVDRLESDVLLPQVGQGALAVECRADDEVTQKLLVAIDHHASRRCVDAERAFLRELGAGCDLPIAAHAELHSDELVLRGALSSADGSTLLRADLRGVDGPALGRAVARCLLDDQGGSALLGR